MENYTIVYNLSTFSEDIFLPSAYIVKYNADGTLGYIQQRAMEETLSSFVLQGNADISQKLLKINEQLHPTVLANKFYTKKGKKLELLDILNKEKEIADQIRHYVWRKLDEWLSLIQKNNLPLTLDVHRKDEANKYIVWVNFQELHPELFFSLQPDGINYKLKLLDKNTYVSVTNISCKVITNKPAWILVGKTLYKAKYINGNMVKPFNNKTHIAIPSRTAKDYFQKFIIKVAAKADIRAEGFEILNSKSLIGCKLEVVKDIFTEELALMPTMKYDFETEFFWNDDRKHKTNLDIEGDEIKIIKVERNYDLENNFISILKDMKLENNAGGSLTFKKAPQNPFYMYEWIIENRETLISKGFSMETIAHDDYQLSTSSPTLHVEVNEANDWFDVYMVIKIDGFSFPFSSIVSHLKSENRFYKLPSGTHMLIPDEWFTKYDKVAKFGIVEKNFLRFTKSQYTLLQELNLIKKDKKTSLDEDPEEVLRGIIKFDPRPYQWEGISWMIDLYHKGLGACLADDMGLGKTLQTIAVLLYIKELLKKSDKKEVVEEEKPSVPQLNLFDAPRITVADKGHLKALILLPASLLFNWENELKKFAPQLSILKYFGTKREKDIAEISSFDVVLTTYQTALRDIDTLKQIHWECIVLDESQQIKNKDAKVFKAVSLFQANHKIALSGTPIENSLSDLWSQMQFINPELLGSFAFFRDEFITPIEKKHDEDRKKSLYNLVGPYLLRRTKDQVAKDLPPLSTKVFYSQMSEAQEKIYDAEKSAVRNYILDVFNAGNSKNNMHVLQSLIKLRQIANHPVLAEYEDVDSGKFEDVLSEWNTVVKSGHKVLIFSSFVSYLDLFAKEIKKRGFEYSYLTGAQTITARNKEIEKFEKNKNIQTFLISIKAGGVGLNLTAADYVFILDPWWNPFVEMQAIARAHRIGQDKNVFAVKFITKNSIEEKILALQDKKSKLAEEIISESTKIKFTKESLSLLVD